MKWWLTWLKGDNLLSSKHPLAIFGRLILSLWVTIIAICALIIGGIFLVSPEDFSSPERTNSCTTLEHNGEAVDTCDFLLP